MIHIPDLSYSLLSVARIINVGVDDNFARRPYMKKQVIKVMFKGVDDNDIYVVEMKRVAKGPLFKEYV